jgi:hypothetical protein
MRKLVYIIPLILLYGCGGMGGGIPAAGPQIVFNVLSNSNDSCRCKANKFNPDTTFGYHCSVIDSLVISHTRNAGQWFAITDSLGTTKKNIVYAGPMSFYFIKKGFPTAHVNIDLTPRAKVPVRAFGCEIHTTRMGYDLYYYTVIIKPLPKKGVRIVPYTAK